ncbi:MAG: 2-amino-4-hydroxy-6-hydroxymethyldihydropteridine diphosphokinase [Paludibacter sp.]|nr:2-amino-4-hydroxy-6-hydroxymethyldihydropteridine diphosphokinase [Paludibacter sp.]
MTKVYLGLGTNLGKKKQNLIRAISLLEKQAGRIISVSDFIESAPWGFESGNYFINAVIEIETNLLPLDLLKSSQSIEKQLGRTAKSTNGYADRIIDIDILLYGDKVIDLPELKIPHPLIAERDFVLKPLLQIAPGILNPATGKPYINHF